MANQEQETIKGISPFYQSFSGTDTLAFLMLPDTAPIVLGSLTTVSYSIYRNKKPVINIGRTNINGITRGSRVFAGTLVFTLINQHWIEDIKEKVSWLKDFDNLKVDELPLLDIMVVSANEYGNYVSMYIYGIDFTDEAQTMSVQDLFTENTFSFVARDISNFKSGQKFNQNKSSQSDDYRFLNLSNGIKNYSLGEEVNLSDTRELERLTKEVSNKRKESLAEASNRLERILHYSTSKSLIGTDVANVQQRLRQYVPDLHINGIYDKDTEDAVRIFQSKKGLDITGTITQEDYNVLLNDTETAGDQRMTGIVINRSGAKVFRYPETSSDIVNIASFKSIVTFSDIIEDADSNDVFYKTDTGYILKQDLYNYLNQDDFYSFPPIKLHDVSPYVTLVQNALSKIYPNAGIIINGKYDAITQDYVKKFQTKNGLVDTGIMDNETWFALQSDNGFSISDNGEVYLTYQCPPGKYNVSLMDFVDTKLFDAAIASEQSRSVKISVIRYFENGNSKVDTKTLNVNKAGTNISLKDFQPYLYDADNGGFPKTIEYFICPYNDKTYKWNISLNSD